jgi:AcrR family transcriptional regulator
MSKNTSSHTNETRPRRSEATRAAILEAAHQLFSELGYDRTTIRDIASLAKVDPALAIRYYGSKEELFAKTVDINLALPDLTSLENHKMGEVLVMHFLDLWEGEMGKGKLIVLLRSAASNDFAAEKMRAVFSEQVVPLISKVCRRKDARMRAGLIVSQLMGLAFCRYVLRVEPVVEMTQEQIVKHVAPTLQRYLENSLTQ